MPRRRANRLAGRSAFAGDSDLERLADLEHPVIAESAETLDERPERDALDRIEIYNRPAWHGIVSRLQEHLARDSADRRRARPDQRAAEARNRRVS